jgi:hypothetical protein
VTPPKKPAKDDFVSVGMRRETLELVRQLAEKLQQQFGLPSRVSMGQTIHMAVAKMLKDKH